MPGPARQLDRRGQEHRVERCQALGRDAQVDGGAVGCRTVQQVVVHLQDEQRALGQGDADVGLEQALAATRCPRPDPRGVVERGTLRAEPGAPEACPAVTRRLGITLPGRRGLPRRHPIEDDVVHLGRLAGHDVEAGDEGVARDPWVEDEAAIVVGAADRRSGSVGSRHLDAAERLPGTQGCRGWPLHDRGAVARGCGLPFVRRLRGHLPGAVPRRRARRSRVHCRAVGACVALEA